MSGFLDISFNINFKDTGYKSLLKKIKAFMQYSATVGIHSTEGSKKVIRRYTTMSKKGKKIGHLAGKSYRMNIAKLAYQNEFGASIYIKPKYRIAKRKVGGEVLNTFKQRISKNIYEKYSALKKAKYQGYLLLDKKGNFVAYFKPNSVIKIPKRPFIKKIITEPQPALVSSINNVLEKTFIKKGYTARSAIIKIAKLVQFQIKNNIHNSKFNHPLTVKAKGRNSPLVDEQDRLSKAIKYKIYRGVKGKELYTIQKNIHTIDNALNTINQFNKISSTYETKILSFTYKGSNPNFL